ncbi:unnamed protein product [Owenia fusiformis]|uniref:Palmitoyltransferase n=2 Tax=Owenia fusiformis TaxID=6347 RepID=A0A8J1Y5L1_OWEFU|nr:unnamed protein product [Owenia fusiformis]
MTPLHHIILKGDMDLMVLLLQHGANVNCSNAAGETPLHFACRRGNPVMIKTLIEHGADMDALDLSGKNLMHFIAQGGSVLAFAYMHEVYNFPLDGADLNQQTPLHIVCFHGNMEAFRYLTKIGRSDIHRADIQGNTPMHICAQRGQSLLCWDLLTKGGCKMLHVVNRAGFIPLDLILKENNIRHKNMIGYMTYYTKKGDRNSIPKGPTLAWYWHLAMPSVLYAIIIAIATQFSNQGLVATVGMVMLLVTLYQHGHRINHVARWPNPIFMGTFGAGLYHTLVCCFGVILPRIYMDHTILTLMALLLAPVLVWSHYTLITRDPGILRQSSLKPNGIDQYSVIDIASGEIAPGDYCFDCEIVQTGRSKHCKLCEVCVADMDHHCLFLNKCIAKTNHRLFVLFVAACVTCMLLFIFSTHCYITAIFTNTFQYDLPTLTLIFKNHAWVFSVFLCNILSIIWGVNLLKFQLGLIARGHLTREVLTKGYLKNESPRTAERLRHLTDFFFGRGPHSGALHRV